MLINILFYALAAFWLLLALLLVVCVIVPHLTPKRPATTGREAVEFDQLMRSLPESTRMWITEHLRLAGVEQDKPRVRLAQRGMSRIAAGYEQIEREHAAALGLDWFATPEQAQRVEYRGGSGVIFRTPEPEIGPSTPSGVSSANVSEYGSLSVRWTEVGGPISESEAERLRFVEQARQECAELYEIEQFNAQHAELREAARRRIEAAVQARYPDCRARFDWVTPPPVPVDGSSSPTNFEG